MESFVWNPSENLGSKVLSSNGGSRVFGDATRHSAAFPEETFFKFSLGDPSQAKFDLLKSTGTSGSKSRKTQLINVKIPSFSPFPTQDFESDSEEQISKFVCDLQDVKLIFSCPKPLSASHAKSSRRLIDILSLSIDKNSKKYTCDFCDAIFNTAAAKGGHIAKNHSSKSLKYKQRRYSHKIRKQERYRNFFLDSISRNPT